MPIKTNKRTAILRNRNNTRSQPVVGGIFDELRDLTRAYMHRNGLTQVTMAEALGVEQQTLSCWLRRVTLFKGPTLDKLIELLRADGLMPKAFTTSKGKAAIGKAKAAE